MENKIEEYLCLADIHEGDKSIACLDIVKQVCKDVLFSKIIFMGDCVNYEGISKYTMKDYSSGVDECEEELAAFKNTFGDILGAANLEEKDCIFTMGNHDGERVDTLLRKLKDKNLNREYKDVKKSLDFKSNFSSAKIIPYGDYFKKNGLAITHCEPRVGSDNHAKQMATRYGCDVMYGHYHKLQVYSVSQKDRDKTIKGYSIPCMCDLMPGYGQNSGNAWSNGFTIVTFHNGTYSLEVVEIKNNKCMFRGILYEYNDK